jgi:hypothetical protein
MIMPFLSNLSRYNYPIRFTSVYSTLGDLDYQIGFTLDKSLIYASEDKKEYTFFLNLNGELTAIYRGKIFCFTADHKSVIMRIPYA